MKVKFLKPWEEPIKSKPFLRELNRELSRKHILYGKEMEVIAKRQDNDDILVKITAGKSYFAVVHLTWSCKIEKNPTYPLTRIFNDLKEWIELCMVPDNKYF